MLHLRPVPADAWLARVLVDVDTLLIDHAHLEKKAASTAINLLFRYPDQEPLLRPLAALAREELEHFEQVLGLLQSRGGRYTRQTPAPYAAGLHEAVRRPEPARLLDTLLCCALIEARSCERMKLLAEHLPDPALAAFYRTLLASEARHHRLYVDGAVQLFGDRDAVLQRLDTLAEHEAAVLTRPCDLVRLHA